ncbi:elicitor-responsive protein 3-like [Tasmannia lanceolata]|uniref:elicitor-responsive protein 3-like n=1 Tax=Tasmannia lanceolata TaxID=3420 RepID=UPI004062DC55
MPQGTIQVLLVSAKALENTDFLTKFLLWIHFHCDILYTLYLADFSAIISSDLDFLELNVQIFKIYFNCNMDPYVILIWRTQEQKSSVASGKGSEPEWNETFVFTVSDSTSELTLKIMDSDFGSEDDFVGEATLSLEPLFMEGSIPPTIYNVVKDQEYCGEIKIGISFTPEVFLMFLDFL